MIENNITIPTELKTIIDELISAHNEKRIKKIRFNNPSLRDILEENEPESNKIYIQIIPKKD